MNRTVKTLEYIFLFLYILRSISDILDNTAIYFLSLRISLSVALGSIMIGVALVYLLILFFKNDLVIDRVGWIFLAWIIFLSPWVIVAARNFGTSGLRGAREWIRLVSLLLFFLISLQIAKKRGYERIVNVTLLALPIPLGVTYYQIIFKTMGPNPAMERTSGTMAHPNILAFFMVVMMGLTIWKFLEAKKKRRYLWGVLVILETPALITPSTMNGWIMLAILLFMLLLYSGKLKLKRTLVLLAIVIVIILVIGSFIIPQISLQFQELWGIKGSPKSRIQIWSAYLSEWRERPLFGYGLDTANFVFPATSSVLGKKGTLDPHNDFIRYLVEGGIFCMAGFVGLQLAVGWNLLKKWRKVKKGKRNNLFIISSGLYLGWILISLTDNAITLTAFQIYFWGTLAAALGGHSRQRPKAKV